MTGFTTHMVVSKELLTENEELIRIQLQNYIVAYFAYNPDKKPVGEVKYYFRWDEELPEDDVRYFARQNYMII